MTKKKALTKILIVNWGVFEESTLTVTNDMVLVGDSGTGKSTILDAVHFVLSGNKKFNASANKINRRTLEEYVLGFTGTNETEFRYLRTGSVVSHIALEFSYRKEIFTIGAVIEYSGASGCQAKFYHIPSCGINPSFYFEKAGDRKKVRNYKEMDAFLKAEGVKAYFDNSVKRLVKDSFQVTDKYFTTLNSAIGFDNIKDINLFFRDILLEESPINIQSLLSTVRNYKHLNETIRSTQEKIDRLEEIEKNVIDYNKHKETNYRLSFAKHFLDEYDFTKKIADLEKMAAQKKLTIESKEKELRNLDSRLDFASSEKEKTAVSLGNNDVYNEIANLQRQIDSAKQSLESAKIKKNQFELHIENLFYNNKHILSNPADYPWDDENVNLDERGILHIMNDYYEKLSRSRDVVSAKKVNLQNKRDELYTTKNKYNDEKRILTNRSFPYSDGFNRLVNHLSNELEKHFTISIPLKPACSFLEIEDSDSEWINAIESILGDKRFSLVIDARYYDKAKEIYDEFVSKNPESKGIEIVKAMHNEKTNSEPNSLFSKLQIADRYVKNYIETCLANIICVTESEMVSAGFAITTGCAVKMQNRYKVFKDLAYNDYFIGERARRKRLESISDLLVKTNLELEQCSKEILTLEDEIKTIISASAMIQSCKETLSDYKVFFELETKLKDLTVRHKSLAEDPTVIKMMEALTSLEKTVTELKMARDLIFKELTIIGTQVEETVKKIEENKEFLASAKEKLVEDQAINDDIFFDADDFIKKELGKKSVNEINKNIQFSLEENQKKLNDAINKTEALMFKYNLEENLGFDSHVTNSAQWISLLDELRGITIMRYKVQTEEKKNEAIVFFKANFMNVMYSNILDCHSKIAGLNKILSDIDFNGNRYKLTHKKTADQPFSNVYDLIMASGKKTLGQKDLLSETFTEEEEAVLEEYFASLINHKGESKDQIEDYTDYRRYMNYDIVISKEDKTINVSTMIGKDSGGEGQTSFYIVVGASLKQCYRASRSPESFPLILLLDEAFGKMDSVRILSIIKYYNDLNSQVIMGVPNDKASTICPVVNTSYYVKKVDFRSACQLFSKTPVNADAE